MGNTTCLLIDDDPDDHELFAYAMQKISSSITCLFFGDGNDAIDQLRSKVSLAPG